MNSTTTISLDRKYARILEKLCSSNHCSKKDFLGASILYLEKYGINPLVHESPSKEMQNLIKRVNQIIAFVRQQEKEILRPTCEAIFMSEERIKSNLDRILNGASPAELNEKLRNFSSGMNETHSLLLKILSAQEEGFKILARLIDAKEKTTVFNDIGKAYNSNEY